MLLVGERIRPGILDGVAQAVQRADAGIAGPREHQLFGAAHPDQLIVDDVRRHADQRQVLAALANDLMAGGGRNEVGETLHRHNIAVADRRGDRVGKRHQLRHFAAFELREHIGAYCQGNPVGGQMRVEYGTSSRQS